MAGLLQIKNLIKVWDSCNDEVLDDQIEVRIIELMREWISDKDDDIEHLIPVNKVVVCENGTTQATTDNHFDSNQSKTKFTVEKAYLTRDGELQILITTKKKWL